jgi:hypothetical protein
MPTGIRPFGQEGTRIGPRRSASPARWRRSRPCWVVRTRLAAPRDVQLHHRGKGVASVTALAAPFALPLARWGRGGAAKGEFVGACPTNSPLVSKRAATRHHRRRVSGLVPHRPQTRQASRRRAPRRQGRPRAPRPPRTPFPRCPGRAVPPARAAIRAGRGVTPGFSGVGARGKNQAMEGQLRRAARRARGCRRPQVAQRPRRRRPRLRRPPGGPPWRVQCRRRLPADRGAPRDGRALTRPPRG